MRNISTLRLVGTFLLLGGCAPHYNTTNDERVDLYLSTLDDKHFVWCELDLEQCRHDFEKWKLTARGRMIIREYEQENTGQTYNTHHLPNVFRTRFVEKNQLAEEMAGEQGKRQDFSQSSEGVVGSFSSLDDNGDTKQKGISAAPGIYGPPLLPR
jgi:hypothetical protein